MSKLERERRKFLPDVWYPLPFVVGDKSFLPVDYAEVHLLRVRFEDGSTGFWNPFGFEPRKKTHFCIQRQGHYEI